MSSLLAVGLVDPRRRRYRRRCRRPADEPLGVGRVGGVEDAGAVGVDGVRAAVVDRGGGHQADSGVAVVVVVVVEELAAEAAGVLDRVEPGRESGPVLERLELRFGVGLSVEV